MSEFFSDGVFEYQRGIADATAILPSLDPEQVTRVQRYMKNWTFYKGNHWSYEREKAADLPLVTVNYVRALINRHANFLMKNGFDIVIPDLPDTKENETVDRDFVKQYLDKTWELNDKPIISFEMAQSGGVTGDTFLYFSWNDSDPFKRPYVQVDIIPSHYCFPYLAGPHGRDKNKVESFLILFPVYRKRAVNSSGFSTVATNTMTVGSDIIMRAELWTADYCYTYEDKELVGTKENPFHEIPIVHIKNLPASSDYYGQSDIGDVIPLQRILNAKATNLSDILDNYANPIHIFSGVGATDLEADEETLWFMPADGEHELCEGVKDISAGLQYMDKLRQYIFELSDTPEGALGHNESRATQESGSAMALDHLPMLDRRALKVASYSHALILANRMILRVGEIMDPEFAARMEKLPDDPRVKYLTEIVFSDPFPRNLDLELDRSIKSRQEGLTTRKRILKQLGVGEAEAEAIIKEALEELEDDAERAMKPVENARLAGEKQNSGNPNPSRPNPDVQGERKSITEEKK